MAVEFSPETLKKFEETVSRYPKKEAAMLPVLYLAQQEFGYVGPEAIEYVAKLMGQSPKAVNRGAMRRPRRWSRRKSKNSSPNSSCPS
jgi:NADH:ubiquinone oxidoreductase subunit E